MGQSTTQVTGNGGHSPDQIQQEIRRTEAELSETLHEIEDRLSPARIKQQVVDRVKEAAQTGMDRMRQQKPAAMAVPAAVAVAGLGLLLLRRSRRNGEAPETEMPEAKTSRKGMMYGVIGIAVGAALAVMIPREAAGTGGTDMEPVPR